MGNKSIRELAINLAVEITELCDIVKVKSVYSNQLLRACSSIGANTYEAKYAQSNADFINKMEIALKECYGTEYWIELLHETEYLTDAQFNSIYADCQEVLKLLLSISRSKKRTYNNV